MISYSAVADAQDGVGTGIQEDQVNDKYEITLKMFSKPPFLTATMLVVIYLLSKNLF